MHLFGEKRSNEYKIVAKSEYFDGEWYLKNYPDVAAAKMDPVEHYMVYGWKENRNPGPNFNTNEYLQKYPECKICPLVFDKNRNDFVDLSVVAIMRNEGPYVKEWIDYHRLVGVKRFYIYDNESTDNLKEVLNPYIEQGVVVYKFWPGLKKDGAQGKAYQDCIDLYKNNTEWLAIIDADEFIVPLKNKTIPDFLKDYKDECGVVINWCMYDSSGHITKPLGGVLKNYIRCHSSHWCYHDVRLKSIVNPRLVITPDAHCCTYFDERQAVTEYYETVPYGERTRIPSHKKIRINHYWTKSKEEYLEKIKKPRQNGSTLQEHQTDYNFPDYKYDYVMWKNVIKLGEGCFLKEFVRYNWLKIKNIWLRQKNVSYNKYFNAKWYAKTYRLQFNSYQEALEHYLCTGWKKGYNPSKRFDTNFYLTTYPDIARANINPLEHYIGYGKQEGRICTPEKSFKKNFLSYLNEAVAEIDYIEYEYGIIEKDEKTSDEYTVLKNSYFFDKKYYLQKYPEVKNSGLDPITHYLTIGYKEGKNPSKYFDNNFYLTMHKDIAMANMNPLLHYLEHGKTEGRVIAEPYELPTTANHTKIHNPLISIIVASYNYEEYIKQTLDSLLAQTYKNFEIIVVDDGSKDNSVSVIQKYTEKYPNVFLYRHEKGKNKGLVETIKLGLSKAKGDYIAFCESDDCWVPEHLQEKVNIIEQYGSPELISNDVELFDHPTKEYEDYLNYGIRRFSPGICPINILHLKLFNPVATFSAAMFRADILRSCNFDSVIPAWTDWWLYRQILINYPLYYVNKQLTKWRIHDSYNKTENSEKRNEKLDEFIFYSNVLLAQTNKYVLRSIKSDNDYKIVSKSRLFNARWYTRQHPEIKKLGVPPAVHFNYVGWRRGFDPSPKFCVDAYLGIYHDIKIWGVNPLVHYLKFGMKEGRWIVGSDVKVKKYLSDDTDIIYKKNILLVSHELSRTGAPMLLMQVAELLKKQNFKVTILSPIDGEIHKDIVDKGIDLVIDAKAFFKSDQLQKDFDKKFDFCICNTYINAVFYSRICAITPSILWIHDNLNDVCAKAIMPVLSKSKNIYAPSKLTKSYIEKYNDSIKILPYPIKDVAPTLHDKTNKKMRIAVVAAIQPRKSQDIFIQAIKSLPKDIRAQAEFLILGKETFGGYIDELKKIANGMPELKFVPAKNNFQEYHDFIESLDVLCCPSREDPCPLVVIDAFMHSVPVIISDHVGQKELITNGDNGYIFENENVSELASVLEKVIINKDNLSELQQKSRQLFENNFSEELFLKQLKKIMRKTCKESL